MALTLYGIPNCDTVKKARRWLDGAGVSYRFHDFRKDGLDPAKLQGWIDAVRKSFDGKSYLQRYTPRGRKSVWSRINVDNVARLIQEGWMTEHGLS